MLIAVPALYGRVKAGFDAALAAEKSGTKRALMSAALECGKAVATHRNAGEAPPFLLGLKHAVLDKLVLSKVRAKFGGKLKAAVTGGAAMPVPTKEFVEARGAYAVLLLLLLLGLLLSSPLPALATRLAARPERPSSVPSSSSSSRERALLLSRTLERSDRARAAGTRKKEEDR